MTNRLSPFAALAGASALIAAGPVWAHTHLLSSDPAANATVASPRAITLTFSDKVVPAFSKFEVTMPEHGGMKVPVKTVVSSDGKRIVGTPGEALTQGVYKIVWTAASADGHKMNGEVLFKVG